MSINAQLGNLFRRPLELVEENFRRPEGWAGRLVGHAMALQHRSLTVWTIDQMNVQPTDRILDMGCGGGMAIKLLSSIAKDGLVCGLDYSREMVRQATHRNLHAIEEGRAEIVLGDVSSLPYGDGVFDHVCGIETFYFWPDPLRGLREAHRVLKPGGHLAITVEMSKEASGRPSRLQRCFGRKFTERSARQGLLIYSGAELTELMQQAGFLHARYVTEPDRSLGWLCALARKGSTLVVTHN
jgi:ubiquinone/menaquinone biosynthesis C-methylase UbiE